MRGQGEPEAASLTAQGLRGLIVAARFNAEFVEQLTEGAAACFKELGGDQLSLVKVPGALEIPFALRAAAQHHDVDFAVALGCVIRGETSHYDLVINESLRGCLDVSLALDLPVGHGILTVENREQAAERCGGRFGNKGEEALRAAVESVLIQKGRNVTSL